MAVLSGKSGTVKEGTNTLAHITRWRLTHRANNSAWASSSTAGYKQRVAGVRDWSGSFAAVYDNATPLPVVVGNNYTLHLTTDGTDEFTGPAIIDNLEFEVDIDDGKVIGWTAEFSGNGALTVPT